MKPSDITVMTLLAPAAGAILGALVIARIRKAWKDWRMLRRFKRGAQGERQGLRYLKKHGFKVLAGQPPLKPYMEIDGRRQEYTIRADFLVRKGRRRAVVDAKTGSCAPDPSFTATRRQLLEYAYHYGVDDVYLYDGNRDVLRLVRFPRAGQRKFPALRVFFLGLAAGIALACAVIAVI